MIIESLGVYLPERLVATADILRGCRHVPAAPFRRLTGIERRPVVGPEEYSIDLARQAIDRCLRLSRHGRETIDLVICCNISRCDGPQQAMSVEPTTAARLCAEFGMSADAFDVSNACAGTFTGLLLAQAAFAAGSAKRALIVSGEHISHLIATARQEIESLNDPRMACLTLGDSGVALLVDSEGPPRAGFEAIELFSLGEYSGLCTGALTDRPHGGAIMLTRSRELTEAALEHCVPHAPATLAANGWDPAKIDTFITHQTAKLALDRARAALNRNLRRTWLHDDNYVFNVRERGNLATNSHFVALYDRARQGRLRNGQRVVFSIAASGLTGGTALYALDDLPERLRQKLNGYPASSQPPRVDCFWRPKGRIAMECVAVLAEKSARSGVVEMAATVARDCLRQAAVEPGEVDVLIYCGVYREKLLSEPAVAALVLGELGIGHGESRRYSKLAFDISDGAVGFLKACSCAAQFIDAGRARRALIVSAEMPGDPSISFRGAKPLVATASAALLANSGDGVLCACAHDGGFDGFAFRTFSDDVRRRTSCCRHTNGSPAIIVDEDTRFPETAQRSALELLEQFPGARHGADWLLWLGDDTSGVDCLAKAAGVPRDRFITVPSTGGELFTSSFAYAWQAVERSADRRAAQRVLAIQAGSGLRVGCFGYRL
ncbi:MAG: 3-oxoacyl-[acyl-carrier-protein] synthase III C-terminal domain-containing protein [Pirellulales bacterium]